MFQQCGCITMFSLREDLRLQAKHFFFIRGECCSQPAPVVHDGEIEGQREVDRERAMMWKKL